MANQGQGTPPPPTAKIRDSVFDEANITTRRVDTVQHAKAVHARVVNIQYYHAPPGLQPEQSKSHYRRTAKRSQESNQGSSSGTKHRRTSECLDVRNGRIHYRTSKSIGNRVFIASWETGSVKIKEPDFALKLRTVNSSLSDKKIEDLYWNEIKIGVKLSDHTNVAKYLNYGETLIGGERTIYTVTQLCDGTSLKALLPKYTMHQKKIIFTHLMYGLEYIHDNEIAHRDLKPSNFLLSLNKKKFKIIDFGISKEFMTNDDNTITTSSGFSGTFGWVASEMCGDDRSKRFEDWKKSDVFSSGLLAYYIFTEGKYPYEGSTALKHASIEKKKNPSFDAIKDHVSDLDCHSLIDLLETMLSHEPDKRPDIDQILQHCFFWDANKNMSFIHDVHRCFEEPRHASRTKKIKKLRIDGTVEQRMAYEIHSTSTSNNDSNVLQGDLEKTASEIGSGDYKTSTSNQTWGNRESRSGRDKTKELSMEKAKERIRRVIRDDWINIVKGWIENQIKLRKQKHFERKKNTVKETIGNREHKESRTIDLSRFCPSGDDCDEQEVDDASNCPCFNINKKNQRLYENSLTDLVRYIRNTHEYLTKEGLPNDGPIPESSRESDVEANQGGQLDGAGQLNETTGESEYSLQDFIKSKDTGMWEFVAENFPELLMYLCQIMKEKETLSGDLIKKYFEEKAPYRPLVPIEEVNEQ